MTINKECARKILLEVEQIPFGNTITIEQLHEKLPEYKIEDVLNIVTLFNKDHYLTLSDKAPYDDSNVFRDNKISCLTEKGYKTLDLIRDDNIWNLIKEKAPNYNELSFYTIFDIANKIVNVKINELFDLPKDLFTNNNRW